MESRGTSDEMRSTMNDLTDVAPTMTDLDDNDVVLAGGVAGESDIAHILIVDHDADCADALQTILTDLPGIAAVRTTMTAGTAFDLLDDGSYDVVGFGLSQAISSDPDIILIGAHQPEPSETDLELQETLKTFRSRVPHASIVLLSVYPNRYREAFGDHVDGCIRKDTNARELHALIDELRTKPPGR